MFCKGQRWQYLWISLNTRERYQKLDWSVMPRVINDRSRFAAETCSSQVSTASQRLGLNPLAHFLFFTVSETFLHLVSQWRDLKSKRIFNLYCSYIFVLFHASTPRIPPMLRRDQPQWENKTEKGARYQTVSSRAERVVSCSGNTSLASQWFSQFAITHFFLLFLLISQVFRRSLQLQRSSTLWEQLW